MQVVSVSYIRSSLNITDYQFTCDYIEPGIFNLIRFKAPGSRLSKWVPLDSVQSHLPSILPAPLHHVLNLEFDTSGEVIKADHPEAKIISLQAELNDEASLTRQNYEAKITSLQAELETIRSKYLSVLEAYYHSNIASAS